ncbi:MAG TPA: TIGR04295 family B12-binding domain-containing radical SAM protein [Bryobacterales bacterium]|jgi:anaerobic magnesium-protoporphyrin IX monomethyl ester cyclase|nr:TIGR04295 family B12-binding domain-containing radical SAM protein [Bryobacterales bacterium]
MRFLLLNPNWSFEGSIYFGCRYPHLPLEYGYAQALLRQRHHEAVIIDAQLENLSLEQVRAAAAAYRPDFLVVTTAPSYLFWRCAPPELRVPLEALQAVRDLAGKIAVVGPHGSTTPRAVLRKLEPDAVVLGECEEILPKLAGDWKEIPSLCYLDHGEPVIQGGPHACDMARLPALDWPQEAIRLHRHQHHRFDAAPSGPGAEMETTRGCPYHCTFCAKDNFRNSFRRRPLCAVLVELDGLLAKGVEYIYFIDEIFLPYADLLEALARRKIRFGIQTRIDLWAPPMIDLLGRAGCVSIEAGVESITEDGRALLDKRCKLSTADLAERLIYARQRVPFVQANLLESQNDNPAEVEAWRAELRQHGVWANRPVPLFPYPGSPEYLRRWGAPDDVAWERAYREYLAAFSEFSDIQEERPLALEQLERSAAGPQSWTK